MNSISLKDDPIKKYLNLDLDSENKFISVEQMNETWIIGTKKVQDCNNLSKTVAIQTELFELLIKKLRSIPLKSGVTSQNDKEWKINQKVNVLFSEIFKRVLQFQQDSETARREVAEALETHMRHHFFKGDEKQSLSSSPKLSKKRLMRSLSTSEGKMGSQSKYPSFLTLKNSQSAPITPSSDNQTSTIISTKDFENSHELLTFSINHLTQKELKSCLIAWQVNPSIKLKEEISFTAIQKGMLSDPITQSDFEKIKQLGIYQNHKLAAPVIQQILNVTLKDVYSVDNMVQDYTRQISRLEIYGSNHVSLWTFTEFTHELDEDKRYDHFNF